MTLQSIPTNSPSYDPPTFLVACFQFRNPSNDGCGLSESGLLDMTFHGRKILNLRSGVNYSFPAFRLRVGRGARPRAEYRIVSSFILSSTPPKPIIHSIPDFSKMAPSPLQQRKTHNTLLFQKLLNLRDGASPFTLVLDSLEQGSGSVVREFVRRAKVCASYFF